VWFSRTPCDEQSAAAGAALAPARVGERPTRVRYGVLAFSVAMSVILYLDRMAISVPLRAIAEDLQVSVTRVGDSMAAFFWCYALLQVPAGWLGDRWGGRRALVLYVVAWSAAMAGIGLASGLGSLIVMRGLLGVGQAGAYATTASFLRRWIPHARRGIANSAVSLGGRAGGVLAPALTPVLMGWAAVWLGEAGRWRPAFLVYAAAGLLWAAWFWRWFRDEPRAHPGANAAEIALIEAGAPPGESAGLAAGAPPLLAMLANRSLLLLSCIAFFVNVGWIFLATWLPTYLIEVHGTSETQAGFATSLTAFAGMAGCLGGGATTDFLVRRVALHWARRVPAIAGYSGAALCLTGCWVADDARAIVALLIVASFLGDFGLGSLWASYQDIGRQYAGTALGLSNMCGNLGAACAISVIGRLVTAYGWPAAFAMAAGAYTIAAVGWLGVDPRRAMRLESTAPAATSAPHGGPPD
jgi:ACS family glucarate transporter-like MFS transporter